MPPIEALDITKSYITIVVFIGSVAGFLIRVYFQVRAMLKDVDEFKKSIEGIKQENKTNQKEVQIVLAQFDTVQGNADRALALISDVKEKVYGIDTKIAVLANTIDLLVKNKN